MKSPNKTVKQIVFFLPARESVPTGGYKVVYEYANRFADDNYGVSIIYPHIRNDLPRKVTNPLLRLKMHLGYLYRYPGFLYRKNVKKQYHAGEWFPLSPKVRKHFIYRFTNRTAKSYNPDAVFVATALITAYELNAVTSIADKYKYYLVQGFEAWGVPDETVFDSYRFPLTKITIAPWLRGKIESAGAQAHLIPNGFDFEYFQLAVPIEKRVPTEIALLYHLDDNKRCCDALEALRIAKEQIPQLHAAMFGTPPCPDNLPEWISYSRCPDRERHNMIYNNAAIFIAASKTEGMALPPAEAMICGCALCCTDIGGFGVYAHDGETALLSPVYDAQALADNIIKLIRDQELRIRLAAQGNRYIRQFTWDRAYSAFKSILP